MKLFLVQHGEAISKDVDPNRPLSQKGKEDVEKSAVFLKRTDQAPNLIWHSSKTRAIESAQIIEKILGKKGICTEKEGLDPNDSVINITKKINELFGEEDLMIVGHLPFLAKLSGFFLTNEENLACIRFAQGGICCLEAGSLEEWQLKWMVTPELT